MAEDPLVDLITEAIQSELDWEAPRHVAYAAEAVAAALCARRDVVLAGIGLEEVRPYSEEMFKATKVRGDRVFVLRGEAS